jgi:hypothetical protein
MTESDWLASTDPGPMLDHLQSRGRASDRKLRLFACACSRRVEDLLEFPEHCDAVEAAERHADGLLSRDALIAYHEAAVRATMGMMSLGVDDRPPEGSGLPGNWFYLPAEAAMGASAPGLWMHVSASMFVEVYGVCQAADSARQAGGVAEASYQAALLRCVFGTASGPPPGRTWLTGVGDAVQRLAHTIYEERSFDLLPLLADALADAGCTDAQILEHLRGPGPHCRGCWGLDLVLGKE